MKRTHPRSQPRIPGLKRAQFSTAVNRRIEKAIQHDMIRFDVSRSFVIAVAVAHGLGVDLEKDEEY